MDIRGFPRGIFLWRCGGKAKGETLRTSLAMTYGRDCRDDPSAGEARRPPCRGGVRAREPGPPPRTQ